MIGCTNNPVPEPKKLLDEETMIEIMYDVALIEAAQATAPEQLSNNNISSKDYIYKKYKIDSITWIQNKKYYAGNLRKYKKMNKKVLEKIEKLK